jgi:hypothetical protein
MSQEPDEEALFQATVAHLEKALVSSSGRGARCSLVVDIPLPVIRAVFERVREHFPDQICRLDTRPGSNQYRARIYLTQQPGGGRKPRKARYQVRY